MLPFTLGGVLLSIIHVPVLSCTGVLACLAFLAKKVGTLILAFPIIIFVKREIQWCTLGTLESYPGLLIGVNKNFKIFSSRLKRSVTRCKRSLVNLVRSYHFPEKGP